MKKLTKSRDKWLCGVIGGLAEYFGWDRDVSRLLFILVVAFGVGSPLLLYVLLYFIMPEAD
ncbi:PspC domain-containing protein [Dolosigranulum pigrum]|uniref:PspC domain-containing protein n=1 Tax=Dolosigranulum pigrum TaxID=29394 RepID=UPI001AD87E19|nr:PspC domain-containing protein [Dolosigranulum pigrum]QTJ36134.1 PspC domain-containing protein [Dolosigranulum pigrum]